MSPFLPLASPPSLSSPPPHLSPAQLLLPTSQLYASPTQIAHEGPHAKERAKIDWSYHKQPTKERAALQDEIVDKVLHMKGCGGTCGEEREGEKIEGKIALFTAGGMGAGKGHTLRHYLRSGDIRLPSDFVWSVLPSPVSPSCSTNHFLTLRVDPDALTLHLPERPQYLSANRQTTTHLLHPEARLLQEVLSQAAQTQERSLVVDGSLSDCKWFAEVMKELDQHDYRVEILFVFAEEEIMLCRAKRRAEKTGRVRFTPFLSTFLEEATDEQITSDQVTDAESIKRSRLKSPQCVSRLSKSSLVRRVRLVANTSDFVPPKFVYDSNLDPNWISDDFSLDVLGFVEGRLKQGSNGQVEMKSAQERAREKEIEKEESRVEREKQNGLANGNGNGNGNVVEEVMERGSRRAMI
ncbi:hypothetical protein P7C70_g3450, partial [Phenoliferia sp. Uapishka_3]